MVNSIRRLLGGRSCYFALTLLLSSFAAAQDSGGLQTTRARDPKLFDRYESELARNFELIRRENNLPKLSRIAHRQDLDQLVCTAAASGLNARNEYFHAALIYKTSDPASITKGFKSVALFHQVETPPISRYAVAVWPGTEIETGRPIYWVGVETYTSAFYEFIDRTFTDDRFSWDEWKKLVDPTCRDLR
jgi:hypothetical protein